jgi:hypothetical protein
MRILPDLYPLLTIGLIFVAGCASPSAQQARRPSSDSGAVSPRLFLKPSPVFDSECSQKSGFKVDSAWYPELFQRLPEFQGHWDEKAAALINTSQTLVGKRFSRTEYSVSLTVCKWIPMGYPFIISLRPFLKSSAAADPQIKNPHSMMEFVSLTHHELLHSLTDDIVLSQDFPSALLIKYKSEHPNVLVHLHLMAVQKAAYIKLEETDLLKNTDLLYAYIGGDYQRAWQIIAAEGADVFVTELQAYNNNHH